MSSQQLATLVERLEKVTARLEQANGVKSTSNAAPSGSAQEEVASPAVAEYDAFLEEFLTPFLAVCDTIGKEVASAGQIVKTAFDELRRLLVVASQCKEPAQPEFQKLLQPVSDQIQKAAELNSKYRGEFANHVAAVASGLPALGWVCIPKTPAPYVKEMLASSQFYSNKILVQFKGKDETQTNFSKNFNALLTELEKFVKKNHTTGLAWNPRGKNVSEVAAGPAAPAPPKGGPPAPAPAPAASSATPARTANPGALFAELNSKGESGVTAGLKHVTKDMKTKNQPKSEPLAAPQPKATPSSASQAPAAKKLGNPKFELEGNKWVVEYQPNGTVINITETEIKHTVYVYRSQGTVINISGKVNTITVDECTKCGIVFENAVASCEVVNSKSCEIQVKGKVPNVTIDKCSGIQLYLSKEGLDVDIVTSKSDAMNVLVPDENDSGDIVEHPVAEQFITKYNAKLKKLVTSPNSHV